jgi:hypothetical protein
MACTAKFDGQSRCEQTELMDIPELLPIGWTDFVTG